MAVRAAKHAAMAVGGLTTDRLAVGPFPQGAVLGELRLLLSVDAGATVRVTGVIHGSPKASALSIADGEDLISDSEVTQDGAKAVDVELGTRAPVTVVIYLDRVVKAAREYVHVSALCGAGANLSVLATVRWGGMRPVRDVVVGGGPIVPGGGDGDVGALEVPGAV